MSFVCVLTAPMKGIFQNHPILSSTWPCRLFTNKASKPTQTEISRAILLLTPTINCPNLSILNQSTKNNPQSIPNKMSPYKQSIFSKWKKIAFLKKQSLFLIKTISNSKGPSLNSLLTTKNFLVLKAGILTYLYYN